MQDTQSGANCDTYGHFRMWRSNLSDVYNLVYSAVNRDRSL